MDQFDALLDCYRGQAGLFQDSLQQPYDNPNYGSLYQHDDCVAVHLANDNIKDVDDDSTISPLKLPQLC